MRAKSYISLVILATFPPVAWASDPTGLVFLFYFAFVMAPWGLINTIALAYYFSKHRYIDRDFAKKHCKIASIVPAFGYFLSLLIFSESHHGSYQYIIISIMLGVLLLAGLPMVAHRLQRNS
jgi:hypothetical protein